MCVCVCVCARARVVRANPSQIGPFASKWYVKPLLLLPYRNHCLELDFKRPTAIQISKRMQEICAIEGLRVNEVSGGGAPMLWVCSDA